MEKTHNVRRTVLEDVPLVEFMYLVFTRMPGKNYRRRLRSLLLCLCDVRRVLINSLVVVFIPLLDEIRLNDITVQNSGRRVSSFLFEWFGKIVV